jgi:hypothetical protein
MGVPVSRALARLAGPESAAEHVRNALQILDCVNRGTNYVPNVLVDVDAARARLRAALAALEGK